MLVRLLVWFFEAHRLRMKWRPTCHGPAQVVVNGAPAVTKCILGSNGVPSVPDRRGGVTPRILNRYQPVGSIIRIRSCVAKLIVRDYLLLGRVVDRRGLVIQRIDSANLVAHVVIEVRPDITQGILGGNEVIEPSPGLARSVTQWRFGGDELRNPGSIHRNSDPEVRKGAFGGKDGTAAEPGKDAYRQSQGGGTEPGFSGLHFPLRTRYLGRGPSVPEPHALEEIRGKDSRENQASHRARRLYALAAGGGQPEYGAPLLGKLLRAGKPV